MPDKTAAETLTRVNQQKTTLLRCHGTYACRVDQFHSRFSYKAAIHTKCLTFQRKRVRRRALNFYTELANFCR